jgi:hypothetical protein
LIEDAPADIKYFGIISKQNNKLQEYHYWGSIEPEFTYSTSYNNYYGSSISVINNADGSKTLTSSSYSSYGYQTYIYKITFTTFRTMNININSLIYLRQYSGYYGCVGFSKLDQSLSRSVNTNTGSWNDSENVTKEYRNAPADNDTQFNLVYENVTPGEHFIELKVQKGYYGYARIKFSIE